MYSSIAITLNTLLLVSLSCKYTKTLGAGHIKEIFLDSTDSDSLILEINNKIYDYCRDFNLESGELSFEEISCIKNVREWSSFPEYDIDIQFGDGAAFEILTNDTDKIAFIEDIDDTEINIMIGNDNNNITLLLEDIFIHPIYYSYFYSPSMKTLFILTADQNDSIVNIDDFNKINLITINWNPTDSETDTFPVDITDYEYEQQLNVNNNNFIGNASSESFKILLDATKWKTYDALNMFMVEVNSIITSCDDPEWLRYSYIPDIYQIRKTGHDTGSNGTFYFDYAGHGYHGVDTRRNRAYGFNNIKVWYYEVDSEDLDGFHIVPFDFDHGTLSSYWALMWFLIALILFCCCCCTIYWVKRRRDKKLAMNDIDRFGGMTAEQYEMTQV